MTAKVLHTHVLRVRHLVRCLSNGLSESDANEMLLLLSLGLPPSGLKVTVERNVLIQELLLLWCQSLWFARVSHVSSHGFGTWYASDGVCRIIRHLGSGMNRVAFELIEPNSQNFLQRARCSTEARKLSV